MLFLRPRAPLPVFRLLRSRVHLSVGRSRILRPISTPFSILTAVKKGASVKAPFRQREQNRPGDKAIKKPRGRVGFARTNSADAARNEGNTTLAFRRYDIGKKNGAAAPGDASNDASSAKKDPSPPEHPGRLNHAARRRIKLIDRTRKELRKKMGIPEGSSEEQEALLQHKLDFWIVARDRQTELKERRRERRKLERSARNKARAFIRKERKTMEEDFNRIRYKFRGLEREFAAIKSRTLAPRELDDEQRFRKIFQE